MHGTAAAWRQKQREREREMCNDATRRLSMHDIRSVFNGQSNVSFEPIDTGNNPCPVGQLESSPVF